MPGKEWLEEKLHATNKTNQGKIYNRLLAEVCGT